MAGVFIASIRRIQPMGPYILGGYSAGGAYAYEMGRQLVDSGEKIIRLLIIDVYVPQPVPNAETITVEEVEQSGVFAGIDRGNSLFEGLDEKQKRHMTSTVRALAQYKPIPFPNQRGPARTDLVGTTKGLNDSANPSEHDDSVSRAAVMGPMGEEKKRAGEMSRDEFETELKSWLLGKRYDFGTNRWESYVSGNIGVHKVEAGRFCNVFSLPQTLWSMC